MAKGIVKIKVLGDASDLNKAVDGVHSKLGGLTGTVGKLAGAFAGMMVVREVGQFLTSSAKAAMEDAKGKAILHTAIKNVTGATEQQLGVLDRWIEKTQAATGFTEEELRPAMVKLTSATKDVSKAQEILAIAMDTSKARGVSLETVTLALEKAQNGQLTGLQRLGIATKDASGAALSFDQILKNLGDTYGGATAAAADTLAGKMERMKLIFGEVKEQVGAALLPTIEKFATFIMDNMPTIQGIMETFGRVVGVALDLLAKTVLPLLQSVFEGFTSMVSDKMPGASGLFEALGPIVDTLKTVFQTAWKIIGDVVKTFIDFFAGPTGKAIIETAVDVLGTAMKTVQQIWEIAWPLIQRAVEAAGPLIKVALKVIEGAVWLISKALGIVLGQFEELSKQQGGPIGGSMGLGFNPKVITKDMLSPGYKGGISGTIKDVAPKTGYPGFYASGGPIPGSGPVPIMAHGGEYVLTRGDTSLMQRLIGAVERGGVGSGGIGPITVYITGQGTAAGEAAADALVRRLAAAGVRL